MNTAKTQGYNNNLINRGFKKHQSHKPQSFFKKIFTKKELNSTFEEVTEDASRFSHFISDPLIGNLTLMDLNGINRPSLISIVAAKIAAESFEEPLKKFAREGIQKQFDRFTLINHNMTKEAKHMFNVHNLFGHHQ